MSDSPSQPDLSSWASTAEELWESIVELGDSARPIIVTFVLRDAAPETGERVASLVREVTKCSCVLRNSGSVVNPDWHLSGQSAPQVYSHALLRDLGRQLAGIATAYDLGYGGMGYQLPA